MAGSYLDGSVQQSNHSWNDADYRDYRIFYPVTGVVLEVFAPDHVANKSNQYDARQRGYYWEATVRILNHGIDADDVIRHVVILPRGASGVNDFSQDVPTPSTQLLDGSEYKSSFSNIDPDKLDGDRCIVQFLGGKYNQPIMTGWFPHPMNTEDPSTGGFAPGVIEQGAPTRRRYKGVDVTVTPTGSVFIDTNGGGSRIVGRPGGYTREFTEEGGDIQLDVKNSRRLEVNFNVPAPDSNLEPSLPQPNPNPGGSLSSLRDEDGTRFFMDKDFVRAVAGQVAEIMSQASGAFVKVDEKGDVQADGPGQVVLGDPSVRTALANGVVHAQGIDPFTGQTYGVLGNTSSKVIVEK